VYAYIVGGEEERVVPADSRVLHRSLIPPRGIKVKLGYCVQIHKETRRRNRADGIAVHRAGAENRVEILRSRLNGGSYPAVYSADIHREFHKLDAEPLVDFHVAPPFGVVKNVARLVLRDNGGRKIPYRLIVQDNEAFPAEIHVRKLIREGLFLRFISGSAAVQGTFGAFTAAVYRRALFAAAGVLLPARRRKDKSARKQDKQYFFHKLFFSLKS
jgi:hypothetical protein